MEHIISKPLTPLLDRIRLPEDLRKLEAEQLPQLAGELRADIVDAVSRTGGHLGAGLGVVELTIALHYVFDISIGAEGFIHLRKDQWPQRLTIGR